MPYMLDHMAQLTLQRVCNFIQSSQSQLERIMTQPLYGQEIIKRKHIILMLYKKFWSLTKFFGFRLGVSVPDIGFTTQVSLEALLGFTLNP